VKAVLGRFGEYFVTHFKNSKIPNGILESLKSKSNLGKW
jgi:hypothetical protein